MRHMRFVSGTAPPRTSSVDWQEVNTAWGQAAMLLNAAAAMCGCKFQKYKVRLLLPFHFNTSRGGAKHNALTLGCGRCYRWDLSAGYWMLATKA
jgi:hypothetical protein